MLDVFVTASLVVISTGHKSCCWGTSTSAGSVNKSIICPHGDHLVKLSCSSVFQHVITITMIEDVSQLCVRDHLG